MEPPQAVVRASVHAARAVSLLPEPYLYGFLRFWRHSEARSAFLMGRHSDHGFRWFFPASFALKTPLPLIALLIIGLIVRASPDLPRAGPFVWVPALVYALLTFTRGINIGHRHLLPLYPFLFVLAARAAAWAAQRWRGGVRWPAAAVSLLAAWYVGGTLRVHPHYLAYFNEAAGGPRNGYRWLVDSNLDWGQDLRGLADYLRASGAAGAKLSYFGTADPAYYGIQAERLPGFPPPAQITAGVNPGDLLAVSATNLQAVRLDQGRRLMRRLREQEPIATIGYSILIYRADFSWTPE